MSKSKHDPQTTAHADHTDERAANARDIAQLLAELEASKTREEDLRAEIHALRADLDDTTAANGTQTTIPTDGDPSGEYLRIPHLLTADDRAFHRVSRVEIRPSDALDYYHIDGLLQYCVLRGHTVRMPGGGRIPVHRHSHALLWLVQNIAFDLHPDLIPIIARLAPAITAEPESP